MISLKKLFHRLFSRRRPFRLTKGGWIFILYTIGVGAGAINTGNNLLYLIFGIFLGLILASGGLSDLCLWSLSVNLQFPPRGEAGEINFLTVTVFNGKRHFPSLSVTLEIEGDLRGEPITLKKYIPIVFAKETAQTYMAFNPLNRGLFKVNRIRLATSFPFGLLYKWWNHRPLHKNGDPQLDSDLSVIIHPERLSLSLRDVLLRTHGEEQQAIVAKRGEGTTFFGIRELTPSDNPKRIHWKASAKRSSILEDSPSRWLVREMEAEEKNDSVLIWPAFDTFQNLKPAEVENLVRFSASLLRFFYEEGKEARLIVPDSSSDSFFWGSIGNDIQDRFFSGMAFLSLFRKDKPKEDLSQLFLRPLSEQEVFRPGPGTINVLESFRAWEKER